MTCPVHTDTYLQSRSMHFPIVHEKLSYGGVFFLLYEEDEELLTFCDIVEVAHW